VDERHDLSSLRVEHAKRRFEESWLNREIDPRAVEQDLDELDIAVGLWLDEQEASMERRARDGSRSAS
jgi:hypothetical protein